MVHWYISQRFLQIQIKTFFAEPETSDLKEDSQYITEEKEEWMAWKHLSLPIKVLIFFTYLFFKAADISSTLWWGLMFKK